MDGGNSFEGRVEVFVHGEWGTVCNDDFDQQDANVVCKMMGFRRAQRYFNARANFKIGSGKIWLDNLKCNGYENSLFECEHAGIGIQNCGHIEDIAVICEREWLYFTSTYTHILTRFI